MKKYQSGQLAARGVAYVLVYVMGPPFRISLLPLLLLLLSLRLSFLLLLLLLLAVQAVLSLCSRPRAGRRTA